MISSQYCNSDAGVHFSAVGIAVQLRYVPGEHARGELLARYHPYHMGCARKAASHAPLYCAAPAR